MSKKSLNTTDDSKKTTATEPLYIIYDQFEQRIVYHFKTQKQAYDMLLEITPEFKKVGSRQIRRYIVKEF